MSMSPVYGEKLATVEIKSGGWPETKASTMHEKEWCCHYLPVTPMQCHMTLSSF